VRINARCAQPARVGSLAASARPLMLERAAANAEALSWSAPLFELLVEEVHAEEAVEHLLGHAAGTIDQHHYAQAIAIESRIMRRWCRDRTSLLRRTAVYRACSGWQSALCRGIDGGAGASPLATIIDYTVRCSRLINLVTEPEPGHLD
jgi:hypothetical protein